MVSFPFSSTQSLKDLTAPFSCSSSTLTNLHEQIKQLYPIPTDIQVKMLFILLLTSLIMTALSRAAPLLGRGTPDLSKKNPDLSSEGM